VLASSSYETLPESSWSNNLNRSLISETLEIQFHFILNMKTVFDKYNKVIYYLIKCIFCFIESNFSIIYFLTNSSHSMTVQYMIVWQQDFQIPIKSVPITTKATNGIKFVSQCFYFISLQFSNIFVHVHLILALWFVWNEVQKYNTACDVASWIVGNHKIRYVSTIIEID
jgi:hypothetical protein